MAVKGRLFVIFAFPVTNPSSHEAAHLWATLLRWQGDPHYTPIHTLSDIFIFGGMTLVAVAWRVLHAARRQG